MKYNYLFIYIDNAYGTSSSSSSLFAMSGDGSNDVTIPVVFLFSQDAMILLETLQKRSNLMVTLTESNDGQ